MKSFRNGLGLVSLMLVVTLCTGVWAAAQNRGLAGQWDMSLDFDTWQTTSVLSFARDTEGLLTAQWVSIMGISEVKDIKREGKDLTFSVVTRLGDQDYTSSFVGTLTGADSIVGEWGRQNWECWTDPNPGCRTMPNWDWYPARLVRQ